MRLRSLTVAPLSVPTIDPFRIASGEVRATRSILVTATLEHDGRVATGLGEGACLPPVTIEDQPDALAAVEVAARRLAGATFEGNDALLAVLDAALGATPVARSAVEVAVLSAVASLGDLPLWRWLSGELTSPAPPIETDITIPILEPARMATLAREWWARGFRRFKIKVGRDLASDLTALEAMAAEAPRAQFQPDANAGLEPDEALAYVAAARARGLDVICFEQPCATLAGLGVVSAALDIPVIADESLKTMADLEALFGVADGINLKIAKTGSMLRCLAIGRAARARGMPLMVGGMVETRLGMTAAAHLAAALGGVDFADLDTAWLLASDPFSGGYEAEGPIYRLPKAPGLGIAQRA